MANKRIQGITIELEGDTTKLGDALKKTERDLKNTQSQLKEVDKLLKLDPGNTELLAQKQRLLAEAVQGTGEKLKTLKEASEQANEALQRGEMTQDTYDALQREIIATEQEYRNLEEASEQANRAMQGDLDETEREVDELGDKLGQLGGSTADNIAAAGEKVKDVGDKVTAVGEGLTKTVTGPIVAAGAAATAAWNEVDSGLDIIVKKTGASGDALEDLQDRAKNLATSIPTDFQTAGTAIGEVNTRFGLVGDALEDLSGRFIKFAELNDTDVNSAIDSTQAAMAAFGVEAESAGDVLDILNKAAQDTGVDIGRLSGDLTTNAATLQELGFGINSATGFLANLNKSGLDSSTVLTGLKKVMQNATKDGKTMTQALGELQRGLTGAKSETEAMQLATELFGSKAAPAMLAALRDGRLSFDGAANAVKDWGDSVGDTFDAVQDPMDGFKTAMNEVKLVGADLVETAGPMIKTAAEGLHQMFTNLRTWWEGLSPLQQETVIKVAGILAALGPVVTIVGKVISLGGTIMTLLPKIQGGMAAVNAVLAANPIALVVAAIAALVAAFAHLWTTSEEFRNFWKGLWDGITGFVSNAVEKIKGFFNFEWKLPHIKLPHFSIQGHFSLNPPSIPHISVDWYRKAMEGGMILTSPTIFPAANGTLRGFGDAGPEAVVGVQSLREMIADAVAQSSGSGDTPINVVTVLEMDGHEFGRAVYRVNREETQRIGVRLSGV